MASQRIPTEVGKKIKQGVAGRKFAGEDLCDPLEMGALRGWKVDTGDLWWRWNK